ncbi:Drimenol monooxygenase-like protein [Drosera capensis]
MSELLRSPVKLKKAQKELDSIVGKGKPIEEVHIDCLPYLRGIVKETFRIHPPVPFLVPRRTIMDAELSGFFVPENTQVLQEWFLVLDIDLRGRHFELLPFGAGRRMCPGLAIANKMLHLILGSLINCFDWMPEGGANPENMDMAERFGFTLAKAQPLQPIPTSIIN